MTSIHYQLTDWPQSVQDWRLRLGKPQAHAYLAGPDVFMLGVGDIAARKKALVAAAGIVPHFPLDNSTDIASFPSPEDAAMHIAQANEKMMADCLAKGDVAIIFANMSPWHRSPSMDVGTAFEMGYYSRMAEENPGRVLIMGYYDNPQDLLAIKQRYAALGGHISQHADGWQRDEDGHGVEDFGLPDNLMLVNACRKTGGDVHPTLEAAVAAAKEILSKQF